MLLTSFALLLLGLDGRAAETDLRLSKALAELRTVGFSVAVYEAGKPVYSKGFGFANRERKRQATKDTIYRLGSISKPIAAVAAMTLWEQGKLDLDADIRKYAPAFPEKPWRVTARQIMSHTSGIRHYAPNEGPVFRHYKSASEAISRFGDDPLLFEPGEKYSYSTHAWTVLAAACERISGQAYPRFLRTSVLNKVGPNIGCEESNVPNRKRTELYSNVGERIVLSTPREDNSWKYAGGGLESDAETLARFGALLLDDKLVRPETRKLMWTPVENRSKAPSDYGLGFRVSDGAVGHSGAQQGCRTSFVIDTNKKIVVVVMANTGDGPGLGAITRDLLEIWRGKKAISTLELRLQESLPVPHPAGR